MSTCVDILVLTHYLRTEKINYENMNTSSNFGTIEDPKEIISALIDILTEKEQDIIIGRFGLSGNRIMTLASIGEKYSVTRERIRQVQNYTVAKLKRNAKNTKLQELHLELTKLMTKNGNLISEADLEAFLVKKYPEHADSLPELKLACVLHENIIQEYNRVDYLPHYRHQELAFSLVKTIDLRSAAILKKRQQTYPVNELAKKIQDELNAQHQRVSLQTIYSAWNLDRRLVVKNDEVSIKSWRHINPRTLNDKINYVLREEHEALHYSQITKKIIAKDFDEKDISVQAIHNELINNQDFVLIGRGIYALKTWGYKAGTVADVLESILAKNGPMHLEDLTEAVLQRRKVKKITVQINLNSKKHKFLKNKAGQYELV